MIIVADTSPLNYLLLIEAIEVLPQLWHEVVVPSDVLDELTAPNASVGVREWGLRPPSWVLIKAPKGSPLDRDLDRGEAAAIQLAVELRASHAEVRLLLDDRKGRLAAERLGLATWGTLAVLVQASLAGLLDLEDAFNRLHQTNFYAPQSLYDELLRRARGGPL